MDDGLPVVAGIGGDVDLAAGGAEVDAAGVEGVDGHGVAEDVDVAIVLGEAVGEGFPFVAAGAAAVDAELALGGVVLGVALDGGDVDGVGLVGMDCDGEAEVAGEIAADLLPELAGVVAAHDVPVFLHEEDVGAGGMEGDAVDAVADLGGGVGEFEVGLEAVINRPPGLAGIVGAEGAGGGDGGVEAAAVDGVNDEGVQAHAAGAGLPEGAFGGAKGGEFLPGVAPIGGAKEGGIFHAGVDGIGIVEEGLEVPDAFEFPRVLGAVVPFVRADFALVLKVVADGFPSEAAIVGALDDLAEPTAGLGGVEALGIHGGAFDVVDFPSAEVGSGDGPVAAGCV